MAILDGQEGIFLSFCNKLKSGAPRESCHMSCDLSLSVSNLPPPSPLLFSSLLIVIVLQSMPTKKDPRNEVGAIVHAVANRVLSDHTAKNTVWVVPTDGKKHHVVTITHEQKWVAGVAAMITGDVADEHTSIHQWFHKDPFSERIAPGNPEHSIMLPLQAFLHMMPPSQLTLMLELTNERLVEKEKQEMTRQELLWWIGVCLLIPASIFVEDAATSGRAAAPPRSTSPPTTFARRACRATALATFGMPSGGLVNHLSSHTACRRSSTVGCWSTTLSPTSTSTARGRSSPAAISRLTSP